MRDDLAGVSGMAGEAGIAFFSWFGGYVDRVRVRFQSWKDDAFFTFRWWDYPAAVWFGLFGPRIAGDEDAWS